MGLPRTEVDALAAYLTKLGGSLATPPKALLVVSAHWEEGTPTVMTHPRPPILYDYYGFPAPAYRIAWPAPGDPGLASRVRALLGANGIASAENAERGFDHGTFIPLKLAFPAANIPVTQLSLKAGLDPHEHLAIGRSLAPLRDEGVFVVGSGMSFHNMRAFGDLRVGAMSEPFDRWLREMAAFDPERRDAELARWVHAPSARDSHPREEHLLPLMVVAGAAGSDRGAVAFEGTMFGARISAIHFG
jgi:aromatic ring-opening dioxygenase catalytic subunit (LigB family)